MQKAFHTVCEELKELGVPYYRGSGGFFVWANFKKVLVSRKMGIVSARYCLTVIPETFLRSDSISVAVHVRGLGGLRNGPVHKAI